MTATISAAEWLGFIEREYLSTFVREGGAAIKFAVSMDGGAASPIQDGLAAVSVKQGYLMIGVDAADTKVHLVDEVFFRVAQQVPWRVVAQKAVERLAAEAGYAWPEHGTGPLYERIAAHNRVDAQIVLLDLKKAIGSRVLRQHGLTRDFRVAMTQLCIAELSGGADRETVMQAITQWLDGSNRAVSAVKPYQIFRKVHRTTARYFFESMTHWLRFAGYAGVVIVLDIRRVMLARNPRDGSQYYTKAAVLDTYEVLRQFIDAIDRLDGCLITVLLDRGFFEDPGRGIGAYEALKFRIFDEIRDRTLVNPMASLARISETANLS
jgi:hypothetical protein